MKDTLCIVIDVQNDFVSGSLGFKEAETVVENIKCLEKMLIDADRLAGLVFTQDTHFEDYLKTPEGIHLPIVHCIEGSWGHEIVDGIKNEAHTLAVISKNYFASDRLGKVVKDIVVANQNIKEVVVVGLVSDICVASNCAILGGAGLNVTITVIEDCTATADLKKHEAALEVIRSWQIKTVDLKTYSRCFDN